MTKIEPAFWKDGKGYCGVHMLNEKELLEGIDYMCQELYNRCGRHIQPKFPWVLVKVLPKIQQSYGLILPQSQNKIFYEGLVLETWAPFTIQQSKNNETITTFRESRLKPGEHVLFPHFEGMPVGEMLDEREFRLVREVNNKDPEGRCEILAKMVYDSEPVRQRLLVRVGMSKEIVDDILDEFHVIPRGVETLTVSGE